MLGTPGLVSVTPELLMVFGVACCPSMAFVLLVTLYGVYSWRQVPLCGGFKLLYSTGRGSSSTESVITCAEAPTQIY